MRSPCAAGLSCWKDSIAWCYPHVHVLKPYTTYTRTHRTARRQGRHPALRLQGPGHGRDDTPPPHPGAAHLRAPLPIPRGPRHRRAAARGHPRPVRGGAQAGVVPLAAVVPQEEGGRELGPGARRAAHPPGVPLLHHAGTFGLECGWVVCGLGWRGADRSSDLI